MDFWARARRKPQRYRWVSRGFATQPWSKRRGFKCRIACNITLVVLSANQLPTAGRNGQFAARAFGDEAPFEQAARHVVLERMGQRNDLAHFELFEGLDLVHGGVEMRGMVGGHGFTPGSVFADRLQRHQISSAPVRMQARHPLPSAPTTGGTPPAAAAMPCSHRANAPNTGGWACAGLMREEARSAR